jgi:hypothetical protein
MPAFEVTAPDGKKFRIEGDHGPNEAELQDIYSNLTKSAGAPAPSTPAPPAAPQAAVPAPPAHDVPDEAKLSEWHPSLWSRFRNSSIGHKILGPTPEEQSLIQSGQGGLAGPPGGNAGILPILSQTPIGPGAESKLGKAILGYYIAAYAKSQPQRVKQIYHDLKTGNTRGAYGGMIEDFLGAGMTAGAAHGLISSFRTPATKGGPNASSQQKAAAVHGDVQPQSGPGPREVPAEEGGGGVQSQAEAFLDQKTQVSVNPYRLERTEDGKYVITNPAGEVEGQPHDTIVDAKVALDKLTSRAGKGQKTATEPGSITDEPIETPEMYAARGTYIDSEDMVKAYPHLTRPEAAAIIAKVRGVKNVAGADLQKGAVKSITEDSVEQLPADEQVKLKHGDGIKYGLTQGAGDVERLQQKYNKASEEMKAAAAKGDQAAMHAAFGKLNFYGGALMGATRGTHPISGTNYSRYVAEHGEPEAEPGGVESELPDEQQQLFDHERKSVDVPVDMRELTPEEEEAAAGNPFLRNLLGNVATIDRKNGKIVINFKEFKAWLDNIPKHQQQLAIRSVLSEERIHLAVDDASAKAFYDSQTGLEQAIGKRRYFGPIRNAEDQAAFDKMTDTQWGHEALRFRLQQLTRMTPREIAEATGREKWTVKSLTALESVIRGIRQKLGTKASAEANAILDKMEANLRIGHIARSGASPAAIQKSVEQVSEDEADKIEKQAQMYAESGDAQSANELMQMAKNLRQSAQEQSFPAARPKKRTESLWQEKFILPGMDTQRAAGGTLAVPPGGGETQPVAPTERASAEASGALPRLTGAALEARGTTWVQKGISDALGAIAEGKTAPLPTFKDFADFMKRQQSEVKPGQLHEMWAKAVGDSLEKAPGEVLAGLVKATWGRQTTEASSVGKKSFFRGVISGAQKIVDNPPPGGFNLEYVPDRTAAELHQDERRSAGLIRQRERVIGALYNKLVRPTMPDIRLDAKTTTPDDLRYGGGKLISAVQDFDQSAEHNVELLGRDLVDEARRSSRDPVTATKRLTAIMDRKSGEVYLVGTYKHPTRGTVLVDPLSPQNQHTPLESMLKRYRVIQSVLRDHPVQGFKEHFKSITDYNEAFGNEAKSRYNQETSYDPATVPEAQFMEEAGGRIERGSGGSFQGPHKELVQESGEGSLEKSGRTAMTEPEAQAMIDHVFNERGTIDSADDVREAMLALKDSPNRQALSGFTKLARGIQAKNPDMSADELLRAVAQRVYENHTQAKSLEEFTRTTLADSGAKAGEAAETEAPSKTSRELTMLNRLPPTATRGQVLPPGEQPPTEGFAPGTEPQILTPEEREYIRTRDWGEASTPGGARGLVNRLRGESVSGRRFNPRPPQPPPQKGQVHYFPSEGEWTPGARRKPTPAEQYRAQARKLSDDLFRLNTQSQADVEDAFPEIAKIRKEYDELPPSAPENVFRKIEDEVVTGHSDVKLTPNEQSLFDRAAAIHAENEEMWQHLKDLEIPVSEKTIFPRMAQDVNSIFARVVRGVKRSITEGTILSKSAWFTKHRVIKAIVDSAGNRRIAAIVAGEKGGKLIAYDQGKGTDMGPFAWSDIVKRQELLDKELEPILKEADELTNERNILERSEARAAVSKRRIANINKRLGELWHEKQGIEENYPLDDLENRVWADSNGKQWRLTDATTTEIEHNMDVRYYKEPFSVLTAQNLKLKQMLRSAEWLEQFKTSPQFSQIARRWDERNIPPGWKRTELPQLRNFVFEPRVADVLNQFHERSKGQTPNILTATNRLLMNAVFFDNPFLHSPNLAGWWMTSRGAWAWMNPMAYPGLMKTGLRAFHDVVEKSPEYVNYLRAGTPLQNTRARQFTENITKLLHDQLAEDPSLAKRISNFLGYANPIKLSQTLGHAATSGLHDILTLQLIYEAQARDPKLKPHEAIQKVSAIMPDYRVPARVLGSSWISKIVTKPNAVWFGAYHYSEGKAFMNMAKGLVGRGDLSRAEALDKIAATALLMAVAYPLMDDLLKKVTGRKDLMFRRAGPSTMPTAVMDVMSGKRTPEQVAPSFVSPAAATVAGISLFFNKNLMFGGRGLPIYNWRQGAGESAKRVAGFAAQSLNPVQLYRDIGSGRYNWDQIFENLAGIRKDYSTESGAQVYGWAYDWAKRTNNQRLLNQFEQRSNEVFAPSKYEKLKNELGEDSKNKALVEIRRLLQSGTTQEEMERELRPSAHPLSGLKETEEPFVQSLSPSQRQTYEAVMARREKVYRNFLEWTQ